MSRDVVAMRLVLSEFPIRLETMSNRTFRQVAENDLEFIGLAMYAAYQGSVDDEGESEAEAVEIVKATVEGEYGRFDWEASFVCERADLLVGAVLVTHFRGGPLIAFTFARAEERNQGIASQLIARSIQQLQLKGEVEASLAVTRTNPAVDLYRRLGFEEFSASR